MTPERTAIDARYVIEGELGRGATATVYRARDLKHDRVVALKVLRPEIASLLGVDRFIREIHVAGQLSHPLIVPLFDSGQADGVIYYTMPCLAAESLRGRITRERRLDVPAALAIAREVADALSYAHRKGVLHRDVKPENILILEEHALVADFGIARAIVSAGESQFTQTGFVLGTPAYMSPEQAAGDERLDARSDIYSLACVLFEMLSGEPPFAAPTVAAMLAKRVAGPPPDIRHRRPEIQDSLALALVRALAPDPSMRFDDASEFAAALTAGAPTRPSASRKTLAVLPFANISADPENDYFSDGLTEELITDLSKIRSLQVTSRTSAMRMKRETGDLRAIARKLGVRYVLEGSVRTGASALRITAQLVDATLDAPLWSEKFSGTPDDVFDLQERVSREIVRALDLTLTSSEDRQLSARPLPDARVLDCFLRARYEIYRMSTDALERAEHLLERGLQMSPGNAILESALGMSEVMRAKTAIGYDEHVLSRAEARARRVVAADPGLAQGQFLLGSIAHQRGELSDAARHLKRAIDLDPSYPDAIRWLALTYFFAGRIQPARELAERLLTLDPLSPISWSWRAVADWPEGQFASAANYSRRGADLDPDGLASRWIHGYTLALGGSYEAAQTECDWLIRAFPDSPYSLQLASLLHGIGGHGAEAREILERLGQIHLDHHESFHAAESHAASGDVERAVALLEAAVAKGFYPLDFIRATNPLLAAARRHPNFGRILAFAQRRWDLFTDTYGRELTTQ